MWAVVPSFDQRYLMARFWLSGARPVDDLRWVMAVIGVACFVQRPHKGEPACQPSRAGIDSPMQKVRKCRSRALPTMFNQETCT